MELDTYGRNRASLHRSHARQQVYIHNTTTQRSNQRLRGHAESIARITTCMIEPMVMIRLWRHAGRGGGWGVSLPRCPNPQRNWKSIQSLGPNFCAILCSLIFSFGILERFLIILSLHAVLFSYLFPFHF